MNILLAKIHEKAMSIAHFCPYPIRLYRWILCVNQTESYQTAVKACIILFDVAAYQ